jgi:hypothetical protein
VYGLQCTSRSLVVSPNVGTGALLLAVDAPERRSFGVQLMTVSNCRQAFSQRRSAPVCWLGVKNGQWAVAGHVRPLTLASDNHWE